MTGPDAERALGALRADWGDAYVISYDDAPGTGRPEWRAWRLDKIGVMLAAATPDELDTAIRADRGARSAQ